MFTGIIEDLAEVVSMEKFTDSWKLGIKSDVVIEDIKIGDSISINGVCLTVSLINSKIFYVDVVTESLQKTNLSSLNSNERVNVERSVKLDDRLGGHIVQGHIEGTAKILSKNTVKNETKLIIELDKKLLKYCIYKGSICLDGISLTITSIINNQIALSIIPHTLRNTTLFFKKEGDFLNIETDMIAKYIENNFLYMKRAKDETK